MKDESAIIAATVRREGNRVSIEWDMVKAAAALDYECARLRERIAALERERDAARRALIDEQHAHESTRITLEQRDFGFLEARRLKEEAWKRVHEAQRERDAARADLAACPVGPAKDAPDEVGWWLMVPIDTRWIRDTRAVYVPSSDVGPCGSKWYKLKVQP